ncbi:MAG: hypothetical protein GWO24_15285, partial [Akkermansiaceae bacterium]|nr:hypothetical protein [Akkermansiaceae bacterium]
MPWRGVWPGTVVDTNDPERKRRIRVRVDQVYGEASATADNKIPDNRLPWAIPGYGIGGAESGDFVVPPVGAGVWVAFWMGDPEYPVWLGGWHGDGDIPDRFTSSYQGADGPCTRIWRTPTGHTFEMRWCDGEEEISVESAGGSKVRIVDATALGGPQIVAE